MSTRVGAAPSWTLGRSGTAQRPGTRRDPAVDRIHQEIDAKQYTMFRFSSGRTFSAVSGHCFSSAEAVINATTFWARRPVAPVQSIFFGTSKEVSPGSQQSPVCRFGRRQTRVSGLLSLPCTYQSSWLSQVTSPLPVAVTT